MYHNCEHIHLISMILTYLNLLSAHFCKHGLKPAVYISLKTSLVGPRRVRQLGGENLVSAAQTAYLMEVQRLLAESLAADEAECHGSKKGKIMDHHGPPNADGYQNYKLQTLIDMLRHEDFFQTYFPQVAKTTRFLMQRIQSMPTRMGTTLRLGKSWQGETFSELFFNRFFTRMSDF